MPRAARSRLGLVVIVAAASLLLSGCVAAEASTSRPVPSAPSTPAAVPAVESLSPADGSLSGGETVTISGTALADVSAVMFGSEAASDVTVVDENTVTAVAPHAATYQPGSVDVSVQIGDEALSSGERLGFEYTAVTAVDNQMQYAFAHWNDYNVLAWGDYNPLGGDCANFVSQTLIARGWTQSATWYNNGGKASSAWSYVPAMDNWLKSDSGPGLARLTSEQRDKVKVGDVAVFDWKGTGRRDHVMIVSDVVTAADGSTDIKLVGHNIDFDYRDLDATLTDEEHPNADVWFYSIP